MKAKISRGGSFRGVLSYVLDKGEAEIVGGNMISETVDELSKEFGITKKLRPDCKNPVWHCSLSLTAGDRLSREKWHELSADFMQEMEFDPANFFYLAGRHSDTDYDHIHIVASRIGLDSTLWHGQNDVFKAIQATQKLEQRHNLTLTAGLGMEKKPRASLKSEEINMAIRTQIKPPRLVCQEAIDTVLSESDAMTAPDFIKRLAVFGVTAVPNIASTGRMSGFSFEYDGIPFTGSKLGNSFKWASLEKRGISYDQDRDAKELTERRRAALDRSDAGRGDAGDAPSTARDDGPADDRSDGPGADPLSRRLGADLDRLRFDGGDAAGESGPHGAGDIDPGDSADIGPADSDTQQRASASAAETQATAASASTTASASATAEGQKIQGTDSVGSSRGGSAVRAGSGNWAKRFKANSAAERDRAAAHSAAAPGRSRRAASPGNPGTGNAARNRVADQDRSAARTLDPTALFESHGFDVKKEGRHLSIRLHGDEIYRSTKRLEDGHWVTCDLYSNGIGDNIALLMSLEPQTKFFDAVYRLTGAPSVAAAARVRAAPPQRPRMSPQIPAQTQQDIDAGRAYLASRGISQQTIEMAERRMVKYTGDGVLFIGRDDTGTPQNVTRRATNPAAAVQKRDLAGSDKRHPQRLMGDPATVMIVEGGIDALAVLDIARRSDQPAPMVLVSGGANTRSFLETPSVQKLLRQAKTVTVVLEREDTAETQEKTDAAHRKQIEKIRLICGSKVMVKASRPPAGAKDMADWNWQQQQKAANPTADQHIEELAEQHIEELAEQPQQQPQTIDPPAPAPPEPAPAPVVDDDEDEDDDEDTPAPGSDDVPR